MRLRGFTVPGLFILNVFLGNIGYAADLPAAYPFPWNFQESEVTTEGAAPEVESLENITGLLVPHHMVVKNKVYEAYRIFAEQNAENPPETIFIIGPNHYEVGDDDIQMNTTGFRTRFGTLEVDDEVENLLSLPVYNWAFYKEHSISAHVDFIKHFFPKAKIVPMILKWDTKTKAINSLAEKIAKISLSGKKTAMIASIDFSHYQTKEVADFHDVLAENAIQRCDTAMVRKLEIDSRATLSLFFKTLKKEGACSASMFSHTNSQSYTLAQLSSTTSHFMAFFGVRKDKLDHPPKRIPGLLTVIHSLSKEIAGQEGRFFMGNDRILLHEHGKYFDVDMEKKQTAMEVDHRPWDDELKKGEQLCEGRDFGIVKGTKELRCF